MINEGRKVPTFDEHLVAVGRCVDRERPVGQKVAQHLDDERLVVHDQHPGLRLGCDGKGRPALRAQESLELGEIDATVTAGRQMRAQLARPDPAPRSGSKPGSESPPAGS
jgi:hypothetical protein